MTEPSRQRNLLIYLCLTAATLAVYWPVLHFGFAVVDDRTYVVANPYLRGGLTFRGLGWAFTTALDQWMPVTWLARMLEVQWFGLNAGTHHLVNVLVHIVNTLLLFGVLNRMTGARWRSASAAALFALHPLHVESVAWVTGLKDVLCVCFATLTMGAYVRFVEESAVRNWRSKGFYGLTLLFFALALMSKPMAVTMPFVLLVLDYWPLGRTRWARAATGERVRVGLGQLLKEKLPFFVLAAASCGVTLWGQRAAGVVASLTELPLRTRLADALLSYVGYLGKTFWPMGLAVYYPLNVRSFWPSAMIAGVGVVGITAVVIWRARREPWLATGWVWYLGTLVPVIGLVQVGSVQLMADRYTYLPLVGIFIMLCWSVPAGATSRQIWKPIICVATVSLLAICAVQARIQVGYWKDGETLFRHALDVTRNNWLAQCNLGVALEEAGKMSEAIGHYEQALQIEPDYPQAHYNLGNALLKAGRLGEAMEHWSQAARLRPDFAEAHYNLGVALMGQGRLPEAVDHLEQALRVRPDWAEAHNSFGAALMRLGRGPEAVEQYEQALHIQPDSAEFENNLGIALAGLGRLPEAAVHCQRAVELTPDDAQTHYNLGVILVKMGRIQEATGQYEEALRIRPDFAEARNGLARLQSAH